MKIDRRSFVNSTLAAAGGVLLPMRSVWADLAASGSIPATVPALSGSGKPVSLAASDLKDLRASLKGRLILPQDAGYDAARQYWDSAFDRHPGLIVLAGADWSARRARAAAALEQAAAEEAALRPVPPVPFQGSTGRIG